MTQTGTTQAALVAGYFAQDREYYSASKGEMILIADMAPTYAANAREALLRTADHWYGEAGHPASGPRPYSWMSDTPLARALWLRAADASEPQGVEMLAAVSKAFTRQVY